MIYRELQFGIFVHQRHNTVDFTHRFGFDGRFAHVKGDVVGDKFAVAHHAVVEGTAPLATRMFLMKNVFFASL